MSRRWDINSSQAYANPGARDGLRAWNTVLKTKSNIQLISWQVLKTNNRLICNDWKESAERLLKDNLFFSLISFRALGARDFSCAAHGVGLWPKMCRPTLKLPARAWKKLSYQGTNVAKRWAFNVQQTLFQQYHANEHEMDISVSLYIPHALGTNTQYPRVVSNISPTQCNAKGGISRDFLLKTPQNYSTEDQMWYAPKCLQHLEVDGLQNGFRLIEFYEQHDEYPVIR